MGLPVDTPAPNIAQDNMHLDTGQRPRSSLAKSKSRGASHAQPPVVLGSWRPERRPVRFREVTRGLEGKEAEVPWPTRRGRVHVTCRS